MLLGEILKRIEYTECKSFKECEITGVSEYSKDIKNGFVFVCVRGSLKDGRYFATDAISRGALAVVTDDENSFLNQENVIIVKNPRKCEAEISKALYGKNIKKLKIIGITGTKGKTTTAKILSECTAHLGLKCVSIGTLGVEYYERGNRIHLSGKGENTTPDSPFIYRALNDAYDDGARVAVLEVSSQALVNYRVYGIPFTVCVFTNFSEDHVGNFEHRTLAEYFDAKRTLFCDYGCKICVVNSDDVSAPLISYGIEHVVEVGSNSDSFKVCIFLSDAYHSEFMINNEAFSLSLGGEFNVCNASVAVVTASLVFGRSLGEFKDVLKKISVMGRYEIYRLNGKTVIIDFAHNRDSFRALMSSVRGCGGKIISLFGSVGERSFQRREELASVAEELSDFIVITSDNPGFEPAEKICNDIYNSIKNKAKARIIPDRESAIRFAIDFASEGDTVLLLGKGHEKFQLIEDKRIPFSEREIIESLGAFKIY